jgi:hypothetical protein
MLLSNEDDNFGNEKNSKESQGSHLITKLSLLSRSQETIVAFSRGCRSNRGTRTRFGRRDWCKIASRSPMNARGTMSISYSEGTAGSKREFTHWDVSA